MESTIKEVWVFAQSATGPLKWILFVVFAFAVLALVGHYIVKWCTETIEQSDLSLKKRFGKIGMSYHSTQDRRLASYYRKTPKASDPYFLTARGAPKVYGAGMHFKFPGVDQYVKVPVRPFCFKYELFVTTGKRAAIWSVVRVYVRVGMEGIIFYHLGNEDPREAAGGYAEGGLNTAISQLPPDTFMGDPRNALTGAVAAAANFRLHHIGLEVDEVVSGNWRVETALSLAEVLEEKDFNALQMNGHFVRSVGTEEVATNGS